MSSSSVTFSGTSSYSSSFQQVLQRAVSIASLPLQQMQNSVSTFQSQQAALSSLQATFSSLQNSIQSIASATGGTVSASSSDSTVAVGSATAGALPGVYSLDVESVGTSTTTISNPVDGTPTVTDPSSTSISDSLDYQLTVNGTVHDITLSSNSLQSLAAAINNSGMGVQATIVNLGSNDSPDYRLAVNSTAYGETTIQLNDGTNDLLTNLQTGTDAQYKVNGNDTILTSSTNQITLAPGVTAKLVSSSPGQIVNITVATSTSNLASALSNFASAYNSAVDALAAQRGQAGGALTGDSMVTSLGETLRQMSQFGTNSGGVQSLSDLGLNLDSTGHLAFDSSAFVAASATAVQSFLGSTTTGGFLQAANAGLTSAADANNGMLMAQINSVGNEITTVETQMTDAQNRINDLQTNLTAQLTAADAAIAVAQQQKTYYADLFAAQYLTNSNGTSSGGSI